LRLGPVPVLMRPSAQPQRGRVTQTLTTSSDLPPNPARVSRSGYADMAPSGGRSVNRYGNGPSVYKFRLT